jgi:hypothetical protein
MWCLLKKIIFLLYINVFTKVIITVMGKQRSSEGSVPAVEMQLFVVVALAAEIFRVSRFFASRTFGRLIDCWKIDRNIRHEFRKTCRQFERC